MKKLFVLTLALVLALSLAACGGKNNDGNSGNENGSNGNTGSITLAKMKQAAKDAGYAAEDEVAFLSSWGAEGGFTVDYKSHITPVMEFKDKAAADAAAQKEIDAGYNHPVQNGKFLAIASIDNQKEISFFENLLNGRPLAKASDDNGDNGNNNDNDDTPNIYEKYYGTWVSDSGKWELTIEPSKAVLTEVGTDYEIEVTTTPAMNGNLRFSNTYEMVIDENGKLTIEDYDLDESFTKK